MLQILFDVSIVLVILANAYGDAKAGIERSLARIIGLVVALSVLPLAVPGIAAQVAFFAADLGELTAQFIAGFLVVLALVVAMDLLAVSLTGHRRAKQGKAVAGAVGGIRGMIIVLAVLASTATLHSYTLNDLWRQSWLAYYLGGLLGIVVQGGFYPPSLDPWLKRIGLDENLQPFVLDPSVIVVPFEGYR